MSEVEKYNNESSGIIAWFAANPVAANLLLVTILLLGILSTMSLRIEGFPSLEPNTISIEVTYETGSVRQNEEGVAMKIEEALSGVAGIKEISSTSTTSGVTRAYA